MNKIIEVSDVNPRTGEEVLVTMDPSTGSVESRETGNHVGGSRLIPDAELYDEDLDTRWARFMQCQPKKSRFVMGEDDKATIGLP